MKGEENEQKGGDVEEEEGKKTWRRKVVKEGV